MSSNQDQQQKGHHLNIGLGIFKVQAVRAIFSDKDQKTLGEELVRRSSNSSNSSPSNGNYVAARRSTSPAVTKLVGSNRFLTDFIIHLKLFLVFICRFFVSSKK
jgi:hypothetical protein